MLEKEEGPPASGNAKRAEIRKFLERPGHSAKRPAPQAFRVLHSETVAVDVMLSADGARINVDVVTLGTAGKWWPAARGCSFPSKLLPTVIRALQSARDRQ